MRLCWLSSSSVLPFIRWVIAFTLSFVVVVIPAYAQEQAFVVVDGRPLFSVQAADSLTATERADLLNLRLRQLMRSAEDLTVKVEQRNDSPTLLVNDKYLLTVTQADVQENRTPSQQAQRWSEDLNAALAQAQKERSAGFLKRALALAAGVVVVAIATYRAMGWLWRYIQHFLLRKFNLSDPEDDSTGTDPRQALNLLSNFTLVAARLGLGTLTILYLTNLFPASRNWSYVLNRTLVNSFTSPILSIGNNSYSVANLLVLAGILLGWVVVSNAIAKLFKRKVLLATPISRGSQEAIAVIGKYALIVFGTVVLLQVWGIDLSSLTIIFSALGVGIGLGFQNIAKNISSGLVLLIERPIQVGDFVSVGDLEGTVVRISPRSTILRTVDQISIIVPNSRFLEEEVINWSYENPVSRVRLPVGVAYGSDIGTVKTALLAATEGFTAVLSMPQPMVFFLGFGESSLDFELRIWIADPVAQYQIKSELYFRIEDLFRQYQIEIPFPQRDLHIRSSDVPLTLSPQLERQLGETDLPVDQNSTTST